MRCDARQEQRQQLNNKKTLYRFLLYYSLTNISAITTTKTTATKTTTTATATTSNSDGNQCIIIIFF